MTQQPTLKFQKDADLAILTFNQPKAHNAVDTETATAALAAVRELQNDAEVRVVIITGAGKAFISGADIAEMRTKTPTQARVYSELGHTLVRAIGQLDRPVIAAINGFCFGGGMEIALVADIRIASERAHLSLPETILGVTPGWGALPRVTHLSGMLVTKELVFTGDKIDARRALELGLINRVNQTRRADAAHAGHGGQDPTAEPIRDGASQRGHRRQHRSSTAGCLCYGNGSLRCLL